MKILKTTCILVTLFLSTLIANAQFTGCYATSNWVQRTNNTNGIVSISSNSISMLADTDGTGNGAGIGLKCGSGQGNVRACISIPITGQIMFDWSWSGGNQATFTNEPFGYCLNGTPTVLSIPGVGVGRDTVNVTQGDAFCFTVSSDLSNSHFTIPTSININNFYGDCIATGIEESSSSPNISSISPNPAINEISIQFENLASLESANIQVFDLFGRLVLSTITTISDAKLQLDVNALPNGQYVVNVESKELNLTKKFIKSN